MYRLAFVLCTFVLCTECALSIPPSLLSAFLSPSGSASPSRKQEPTGLTTYDQKQSGKYNIHLNIKDVAIIALDAGRVDSGVGDFSEDYYEDYDLSDFTVKPISGLIDIPSDKPSSTTAPPLIHFEPDTDESASNANETENVSHTPLDEPIIKDPVNKTQSVIILSDSKPSTVSILSYDASSNGTSITTSTPAPEDLPPKPSLAELANVQSASKPSTSPSPSPVHVPILFPTNTHEIPVQIILEPLAGQLSRQRPNSQWRLKERFRATPSNNRRITAPHPEQEGAHRLPPQSAIGNVKHRKSSLGHAKRRNCVLDQSGQCQNSNRRHSSPTLNSILSILSFLSPQAMEKLE